MNGWLFRPFWGSSACRSHALGHDRHCTSILERLIQNKQLLNVSIQYLISLLEDAKFEVLVFMAWSQPNMCWFHTWYTYYTIFYLISHCWACTYVNYFMSQCEILWDISWAEGKWNTHTHTHSEIGLAWNRASYFTSKPHKPKGEGTIQAHKWNDSIFYN